MRKSGESSISFSSNTEIINDWEDLAIFIKGSQAAEIESSAVGAYVASYLSSAIIRASYERLTKTCKRPVAIKLLDDNGNANALQLINNTEAIFKVKSVTRPMESADISDSNEIVSKTAIKIADLDEKWKKLMGYLNPVLDENASWFNDWFPNDEHFEIISEEPLNLTTSNMESEVNGNSQFVSITNLPNDVNLILNKDDSDYIKITLQAAPNSLPADISGKIQYTIAGLNVINDFTAKLNGEHYNYKMEIGHYTLDQTVITDKIVSNNEAVTLPNNVSQYIRLTLDGEPVTAPGGSVEGGWYLWHFGDSVEKPVSTDDVFIEDYLIRLTDFLHGNIEARFNINLTLSNEAFRNILNHTFRMAEYNNGSPRYGYAVDIKFQENGKFSVNTVYGPGSGNYSFFLGGWSSANMQCVNYVIDKEIIGTLKMGGIEGISGYLLPEFVYIQKDGTLRANVMPYGCLDNDSGWLIEKID